MGDSNRLATLIVIVTGSLWGIYWIPVRALAEAGFGGAWGTLGIVSAAALMLAPAALTGRRLAGADTWALAALALGGVAFMLYSVSFLYGRVAVVILLYFLTPVWSTLIARAFLGWPVTPLRAAAVTVGVAGLLLMLGGDGGAPWPGEAGEWLGLGAGLLWSVATTGMRVRPGPGPIGGAFVFASGAVLGAGVVALLIGDAPGRVTAGALGWAVGAGALWWGASVAGLTWAAARLEPARVGILLMAEVLVGAATAAWFAGESLGPFEIAGGALVLAAGILEVWPGRKRNGRRKAGR